MKKNPTVNSIVVVTNDPDAAKWEVVETQSKSRNVGIIPVERDITKPARIQYIDRSILSYAAA